MRSIKTIAIVLLITLFLTACGGSTPATTAATTTAAPETTTEDAKGPFSILPVLDFLQQGEIYVDYNVSAEVLQNFSVSIDGKALTQPGKAPFGENSQLQMTGEGKNTDMIYIYALGEKKQEDGSYLNDTRYFNSFYADKAAEALQLVMKTCKSDRMYLAILTSPDGYSKDLAPALTEALNKLKDLVQ